MEIRWYKYARALSRVLQFREREGPEGEDWWGEWKEVPMAFEKTDEYDRRE